MSREEITNYLDNNPGEHTTREIIKGTGLSKAAVYITLTKLRRTDFICCKKEWIETNNRLTNTLVYWSKNNNHK